MAKNVDVSKITGINQVGNSYQRKEAIPLDYYSLFNTKTDAEEYAAHSPVAYIGQILSVVKYTDGDPPTAETEAYIITLDNTGKTVLAKIGGAIAWQDNFE